MSTNAVFHTLVFRSTLFICKRCTEWGEKKQKPVRDLEYTMLFRRDLELLQRWEPSGACARSLLLERSSWRHVRGIPWWEASLLRAYHGGWSMLPCQHASCLCGGQSRGECWHLIVHMLAYINCFMWLQCGSSMWQKPLLSNCRRCSLTGLQRCHKHPDKWWMSM